MRIPLRQRHLFFHPESDCYFVEYLTQSELSERWDEFNQCDDVTGIQKHEETYKKICAEIEGKIGEQVNLVK